MSSEKAEDKLDFAAGLAELEGITAWFEAEDVDLDAALAKFERGLQLSARLKEHLQAVENRVEKIKQKFDGAAASTTTNTEEVREVPESEDSPSLF